MDNSHGGHGGFPGTNGPVDPDTINLLLVAPVLDALLALILPCPPWLFFVSSVLKLLRSDAVNRHNSRCRPKERIQHRSHDHKRVMLSGCRPPMHVSRPSAVPVTLPACPPPAAPMGSASP